MNDSQSTDYLQTLKQLIQPRKDWYSIPEIINLSFKAISHELEQHLQNFLEHKTLINEQSIKIKQLEIKLQNKLNKKDLESQVLSIINYKSGSARQLEDSLSQYDKLLKQSRYDRDRNFQTVEELKTIAEIITKKREEIIKKDMQDKLLVNKLEIQQQISNLKENIKSRMVEFEKQRREWVNECKQAHSRLEQSALRASHLQAQDKIGLLENSNKRMSDSLNLILNHLQNYTTKEQINAILERQREKQRDRDRKSPQHIKQKDTDKSKKKDEEEIVKLVQSSIRKIKNEERKEWIQFKQGVNKEIGTMISIQAVNNIVDNLTKNLQEKYQAFTLNLNKLEQKFISHTKPQQQPKENISKSERRAEKKVSPSKSIESIQSSLARLQKNIVDRQNSQFRRLQEQVETRIQNYDSKLMQEMDRREKHLCEVIQQTYNQSAGSRQPANLKQALRRLNQTNLYAKYLYLGVKQCKKQSCLVWQKETLNNLTDNFVWKKDSNFIFINTPGLYKIEVGLFGVNIPEATLLVNSEPIATLPTPQNRRNTGAKIRGSSLTEFLILPAKVKLSVRVDQNFYGQAFLFLQLL